MDIKSLPAFSTILAPSYQHGFLRVLFSSDRKYANITILTCEQWLLKNALVIDSIAQLFMLKQATQTLIKQYPTYAMRLQDPSFLKECITFYEQLCIYDIDLSTLPQDNLEDKALFDILSQIQTIPLHSQEVIKALDTLEAESLPYILPACYSPVEQRIIKHLEALGAITLETKTSSPLITFYHTNHNRQVAQACAQYLIQNHIDAQTCTVLLSDETILPFIHQVFQHYQIPYTLIQESHKDDVIQAVIQLLTYAIEPTSTHLVDLLNSNVFKHPQLASFLDYIQLFDGELQTPFTHIQTIDTTSELINQMDKDRLNHLEAQAELARIDFINWLSPLLNATTPEAILESVYELIYTHKQSNQKQLIQLQTLFESVLPYLHEAQDYQFFIQYLNGTQTKQMAEEYRGVMVSTLQKPLPYREHLFVLGCTQDHYPAFPTMKGTFDEAYVSKLSYPSMNVRYQQHMKQLQQVLCNCDHLFLCYGQGDFAGKGKIAALEIELFAKRQSVAFPMIDTHQSKPLTPSLHPDTAKALFVKDNVIKGSISSLERYVNCPFAYFIKYGLKIQEPLDNTFSANRIGTLSHFVLETLVKRFGKAYAKVEPSELRAIIHEELLKDGKIYPPLVNQFYILEERMFENLKTIFTLLQDMEDHTCFQPFHCEYAFLHEIPIDEETTLVLKGIIDRIDVCGDMIRIIDYKSSHKQLSQIKVFAAQQLQLLTYALIAQTQFQKHVVGAYYYSLKNENINVEAGKMKRRPVMFVSYHNQDYADQKMKAQRLDGWTFDLDGQYLDDDANHIKGFSMNKNEEVNIRKVYDIEELQHLIHEMLSKIVTRIKSGDIALEPSSDACLYCEYHPICRFKGQCFEKKPLVETSDALFKKGGKSYDELES